MGFYYSSIFSIVPLGIAYGLLALIYWGVVRASRGTPARKTILSVVGAVFLVLPVGEELWIAWNFGQACKEAGTFITKRVQADGFYDTTMRSAYENTKPGRYRFVEQATEDGKGVERVERVEDELKSKALAWYSDRNPGKSLPDSVVYPLDDNVRIVVSLGTAGAWKVTRLDRPTARYYFRYIDPASGTPWAHKIVRSGSAVIDGENNREIARYVSFGRRPAWFFIGLDTPAFACDAPGRWPLTKGSRLIFPEVLNPAMKR